MSHESDEIETMSDEWLGSVLARPLGMPLVGGSTSGPCKAGKQTFKDRHIC